MNESMIPQEEPKLPDFLEGASKNQSGFQVPDGYFEGLNNRMQTRLASEQNAQSLTGGQPTVMRRLKWYAVAAAASVVVILASWWLMPSANEQPVLAMAAAHELSDADIINYLTEESDDDDSLDDLDDLDDFAPDALSSLSWTDGWESSVTSNSAQEGVADYLLNENIDELAIIDEL